LYVNFFFLQATQYRCHPRIADLASHLFYEGRLKSGVSEDERRPIVAGFDPLMVVDTAGIGVESKDSNGSWSNAMHTRITVQLLLSKIAPNFPSPEAMAQRVGVISMFRAQTRELRKAMALHQILSSVRVSTVDSFQGAECDVIIVVSSRVGDNAGGSFLSDTRRLNVTLTRCKYHCIIIGDAKALKGASKEWATIVNQSRVVYADNLLMD
jgi:superfamily I DNA and/or RNA helicase